MAEFDIAQTTTPTAPTDYSIGSETLDSPTDQKETFYDNLEFTKYNKAYKTHAKIGKSIQAWATWVLGQGWTASSRDTVILENIDGWGEDTINSVLWNMLTQKKAQGDAFAEIVRNDSGTLVNLIPMNGNFVRIVTNKKGRIIRYEITTPDRKGVAQSFTPEKILHLCNDRVGDEIHGNSDIRAVEWNVEASQEAMRAHRKIQYRNGIIRVIEVDTDNTTKIAALKVQWKKAIEEGDVLIMPKGVAQAQDFKGTLDTQGVIMWLNYLDDDFYISIGIPKPIAGASAQSTEAESKMLYLAFEPQYTRAITELEADIWNQLAIRIKFGKQASLKDDVAQNEAKNTGQVGIQPKDTQATTTRE